MDDTTPPRNPSGPPGSAPSPRKFGIYGRAGAGGGVSTSTWVVVGIAIALVILFLIFVL